MVIDCHDFAERVGSWLLPGGPEADVVVSSRVRLARNVEGYPFVARLAPERAEELCERLRTNLVELALDGETHWIAIQDAPPVLRLLLQERHLVSRDLAPAGPRGDGLPARGVAFGSSETMSIMVNEEDHLRLQSMSAGFDLDAAWDRACEVDRWLEQRVPFAHTSDLGYLTCCPTNVGTGLRASVMLHLPALGLVRSELEKVFTAAQRTHLAVRGLYGEGSRAVGDFYQISNQVTLGRAEGQLLDELRQLIPVIVRFERTVRKQLLEEQRAALRDRVSRSLGMLRAARSMATDGALAHLSNIRLGHYLGLADQVDPDEVCRLRVQIQKGHVLALSQKIPEPPLLDTSERDRLRASFLRRAFASHD